MNTQVKESDEKCTQISMLLLSHKIGNFEFFSKTSTIFDGIQTISMIKYRDLSMNDEPTMPNDLQKEHFTYLTKSLTTIFEKTKIFNIIAVN